MQESKLQFLEVGKEVIYQNTGKAEDPFYFVITEINSENKTVSIERYLKLTASKDTERPFSRDNVPLSDIEFLFAIDRIKGIDPRAFKVK